MIHTNQTPPTIAFVLPSLGHGGAERVVVTIANQLANKGLNVDLVVASAFRLEYASEVSDKVNLIILRSERMISALPAIRKYLKQHKPDAIMATMKHVAVITKLALLSTLNIHTRFVIREARLDSPSSYLKRLPLTIAGGIVYRSAHQVIAQSHSMADSLTNIHKLSSPAIAIPNPVIDEGFLDRMRAPYMKSFPWAKGHPYIIGMGRLSVEKGFANLIQAYGNIKSKIHPEMRLVILGEGEARPALEKLVEELQLESHIWMPGFIQNPVPYLQSSELFVLSSSIEGSPNALVQALATGTPCVSTNCPTGPDEILQHGKQGKLVKVNDVNALSEAMLEMLKDPILPDNHTIRTHYSATASAERYLQILLPALYGNLTSQ